MYVSEQHTFESTHRAPYTTTLARMFLALVLLFMRYQGLNEQDLRFNLLHVF